MVSLHVIWIPATCVFWERQCALAAFSACFGIWRTPIYHATVIPTSLTPLFPVSLPFPAPASLQLISALQAVVTTHHIMTWSRETEALAPCPATHWAHKVATFTFRAQIGPARSHQAEMQGQQLFPVWPPPLCPPPFVLLCPAVTLFPPWLLLYPISLPKGLTSERLFTDGSYQLLYILYIVFIYALAEMDWICRKRLIMTLLKHAGFLWAF